MVNWLLGALLCVSLAFSCSVRADYNANANALAGFGPATNAAWAQHNQTLAPQWEQLRNNRLRKMTEWRNVALTDNNCKTMLYPFSGPDFLNAYTLFPNCDTYIFFGLEQPGHLPDLSSLPQHQLTTLLDDFRTAMGDIFMRNFFITDHMSRQLHTAQLTGVTPIISTAMVAFNLHIDRIEHERRLVRIFFTNPITGRKQKLIYYSLDATNAGLQKMNPRFLDTLRTAKPTYTLLKSASYLLHDPQFTGVRDVVLEVSTVLVQDDTGVPYKFLTRGWDVKFYGQYVQPIEIFRGAYQPDLDKAYKSNPPSQLPFQFGYHWRSQNSGLVIARKLP